jgi:drug/metabolite transporter (DMT)-like permease
MTNLFFLIVTYNFFLALSQVFLKTGLTAIGSFNINQAKDIFNLAFALLKNWHVLLGTALLASSFFLWIFILSWVKLSIAFPMTALGFVFIALLSYFMLGEKLLLHNYLGIGLISAGVFLLLFKQM